jgi:hypothetical protein
MKEEGFAAFYGGLGPLLFKQYVQCTRQIYAQPKLTRFQDPLHHVQVRRLREGFRVRLRQLG